MRLVINLVLFFTLCGSNIGLANVISFFEKIEFSPLYSDAEQAYFLRKILEKGADVNAQNNRGQTALHRAVILKNTPCIEVLLEYKADVMIKDNFHKLPLDYVTNETNLRAPVGVELLNYAYAHVYAAD